MDSKQHMLVKATKTPITGITIDGRQLDFHKKNAAVMVNDDGLAREVDARYGRHGEVVPGQVVALPIRNANMVEGHHSTFTVPALPWKDKDNDDELSSTQVTQTDLAGC
jgi:hypothetical protein